jgi:hypothetical protein
MIVVDASAMTEFLLQTPLDSRVEARLFRGNDEFHAPHLLDAEAASPRELAPPSPTGVGYVAGSRVRWAMAEANPAEAGSHVPSQLG